MTLRVYISGAQLSDVALGEDVTVQIDKNKEEYEQMIGTVTWISPEAEFTPQMIQTKEERVTQVYAVKIRVDNPEGILKIGMPGEVKFNN
jgi:HlyD family secretion protein